MTSIQELMRLYAEAFSEEDFDRQPVGLYDPVRHMLSIPGKRIRPLLVLLGIQAFGGDPARALDVAHATELFHSFTLVHDDIIDRADLRRGIATVHQKYGLTAGILSGDTLLAYAYQHLSRVESDCHGTILHLFTNMFIEVLEGQQMDTDFESRTDVTVAEYLTMAGYKTSVLLGCCLQMGAVLGRATDADQIKMYDFGLMLGLSFQVMDDWLDTFGETGKVGKRENGDILQNKRTYLLVTLMEDADVGDREELAALLKESDVEKKVSGIRSLYEKYLVSQKTLEKAAALHREALSVLDSVQIPDSRKTNLHAVAELLKTRNF